MQDRLLKKANSVFPGGVLARHRLPDDQAIVFSHGQGVYLFDADGRRFLDFTCGGGTLLLGYDHPAVVSAISETAARGLHFISLVNRAAIDFAESLLEVMPCGDLIRFTTGGAEGTFMALRLARAFTGREKVLKFAGAYHGNHDYAMWNYLSPLKSGSPVATVDTAGVPKAIAETMVVAPFNNISSTAEILQKHSGEIAAIIVEPVQRLVGADRAFLLELRQLATQHGIVLIFDETVTGFRLSLGGAQEAFDIVPDLAVYGKTLGGGLPLAAVSGKQDIMRLCDPRIKDSDPRAVYFSGTGYGNPIACAAGLAMLKELKKPGCYKNFLDLCERLKAGLQEIITRRQVDAQVIGFGPMWHLIFTDKPITDYQSALSGDRTRLLKLHHGMIQSGIFVRPGGGHYFSFAHRDVDVDKTLNVIDELISNC